MDKRERIVFDLVDGGHEIAADDDGRGRPGEPPGPAGGAFLRDLVAAIVPGMVRARGWVSRHRVVSLIATGVAAAVVLSAAAFGSVRERAQVDLLRAAPGGVESLARPPVEAWRYEPDGDTNLVNQWWQYRSGVGAVTMGSNVVFLEGEPGVPEDPALDRVDPVMRWADADLVAIDAGSGDESWRVPLGVDPQCTSPLAGGTVHTLDEIVCLVGRSGERSVMTVTTDGETSEPRRLDLGDHARPDEAVPAGDGLLIRARVAGDMPVIDCSDATMVPDGCRVLGDAPDRAVTVLAENARTGNVVWRNVVPWNDDLGACQHVLYDEEVAVFYDAEGDVAPAPDASADAPRISFWTSLINVQSCGISATFLPDGTMVQGDEPVRGGAELLAGGLIAEGDYDLDTGVISTTLRTTAGQEILTTDGDVMTGQATDGTPSDLIVVGKGQGDEVRAYREDGTQVWKAEISGQLIARVRDTGIFHGSAVTSVGIDLRTGRRLWESDGGDAGSAGPEGMITAFTDGNSVMLARTGMGQETMYDDDGSVLPESAGTAHLVAVDVVTGRTRWSLEHDDQSWFAANGRLLSVADDGSLVGYRG